MRWTLILAAAAVLAGCATTKLPAIPPIVTPPVTITVPPVALAATMPTTIEGANQAIGPHALGSAFINCHEDTGTCLDAPPIGSTCANWSPPKGLLVWVYLRKPTPGGPGYQSTAHCQVLSDPNDTRFPYLPDGTYLVTSQECPAGVRCLCTQADNPCVGTMCLSAAADCGQDEGGDAVVCTPGAVNEPGCPISARKALRPAETRECQVRHGAFRWSACRVVQR